MSSSIKIIGLMSGTSVDGLDICCVSFNKNNPSVYSIINCETINYNDQLKNELINIINFDEQKINELDIKLGKFIGESVLTFIQKNKLKKIDLISSHGHTVYHQPSIGKTLQIGSGQTIYNLTNIKTVNNFREQDVKFGGQGAPLVPIGDKILFSEYKYCLNLGGFANISIKNDNIYAYDICPLNTVLNYYSKKIGFEFDIDGKLSKKGNINVSLFDDLNKIIYYHETHPKSLGIEFVNEKILPLIDEYNLNENDVLATFIKHVSYQISKNIDGKEKVHITGGGSFNKSLIKSLKDDYNINLLVPEDKIINYKEALIFALLGYLKINNKINCLKSVTGASKNHSSGDIYF